MWALTVRVDSAISVSIQVMVLSPAAQVPCPRGAEDPFPRMSVPVPVGALLTVVTSCTDGDADPDHGLTAVWASADGGDHWDRVPTPADAARLVPLFPVHGIPTRGVAWFGITESNKVIVVEAR